MSSVRLKVTEKALVPSCFKESEAVSVGSPLNVSGLVLAQAWGADYFPLGF